MGKEIERKFLVNHQLWARAEKPQGQTFRQGYLLTDPNKTIRVRIADAIGTLTIKGITTGATRAEFEYQIPVEEARELLEQFSVSELSKTRYKLEFAQKTWEVDVFSGDNQGLIVAEIELDDESEPIDLPAWIEQEVTNDARYYNSNLTILPFKNW